MEDAHLDTPGRCSPCIQGKLEEVVRLVREEGTDINQRYAPTAAWVTGDAPVAIPHTN